MFTFPLIKGTTETVFASRDSIVITERMAAKYFGSEDPIGQSLLVNNDTKLMVTGLLKSVTSLLLAIESVQKPHFLHTLSSIG